MPNCFFQVQANFNMTTINSTKIYFENKDAFAGSSIYGGNIDDCFLLAETNVLSIVSNSSELFDTIANTNEHNEEAHQFNIAHQFTK